MQSGLAELARAAGVTLPPELIELGESALAGLNPAGIPGAELAELTARVVALESALAPLAELVPLLPVLRAFVAQPSVQRAIVALSGR